MIFAIIRYVDIFFKLLVPKQDPGGVKVGSDRNFFLKIPSVKGELI